MDIDKDPTTDKEEFESRLNYFVNQSIESERNNMVLADVNNNLPDMLSSKIKVQCFHNWKDSILSDWEAADQEGRSLLVNNLKVDPEEIYENFKSIL